MFLVLGMAVALWGMGALMRVPVRARAGVQALLFGIVIVVQLTLPAGHPMREATGGSAVPWLYLLGIGGIVGIYGAGVRALKRRARPVEMAQEGRRQEAQVSQETFSEKELGRYARHIVLREIGGPGQKKLKNAKVLVIGAGGLGSPALLYLAAAGVGTIGVIDDDVVENANLQRQIIHRDADIGVAKVASAKAAMEAQNPSVAVRAHQRRLEPGMAEELFAGYDLVLDGTDNFATRYLANEAAVAQGKPLISGALSQWEGQVSVFDPANGTPCYQCVFPEAPAPGLAPSCAEAGVIGPLPGVVGAMMAVEAIKVITGAGQALRGEMLIYDALYGETRKITLKPRGDCPVCGKS